MSLAAAPQGCATDTLRPCPTEPAHPRGSGAGAVPERHFREEKTSAQPVERRQVRASARLGAAQGPAQTGRGHRRVHGPSRAEGKPEQDPMEPRAGQGQEQPSRTLQDAPRELRDGGWDGGAEPLRELRPGGQGRPGRARGGQARHSPAGDRWSGQQLLRVPPRAAVLTAAAAPRAGRGWGGAAAPWRLRPPHSGS